MTAARDLLRRAADEYAPSLGELDARVSDKAFEKGAFFGDAAVGGDDPFKLVRDAAVDVGTVLYESRGEGVVLAMLKGGAGGMSPVLLAAVIEGQTVSLGAYSKEGLIRQHAAREAVRSFSESLRA